MYVTRLQMATGSWRTYLHVSVSVDGREAADRVQTDKTLSPTNLSGPRPRLHKKYANDSAFKKNKCLNKIYNKCKKN